MKLIKENIKDFLKRGQLVQVVYYIEFSIRTNFHLYINQFYSCNYAIILKFHLLSVLSFNTISYS